MRQHPTAVLLLLMSFLPAPMSIQVIVPEQERRTALFGSVILRCDYTTSANLQDVLVTWRFKSFCRDPVLEYYSSAYQSALQLGQDPANDCPDRQRTVRTVIQKRGNRESTLGAEYQERKISIQNNANLVISEVMWWDNGVYFCSVDAAGDTTGDSDKEIKLIVFHWLTVLGIILGALLLILLICICCCQCCPQICCCYVRCPCCPQKCCCPEELVQRHRMIKNAQKAMNSWAGGHAIYPPMTGSSQLNPLLYAGSASGKNFPMGAIPLPPPQSTAYSMPPPSANGYHPPSAMHPPSNNSHMLDYLEGQVKGMDVTSPMLHPAPPPHMHQMPPPAQHRAVSVPFSPGPPSLISALDDHPGDRRIITIPPIRAAPGGRFPPAPPRTRPPSSSESSRTDFNRRGPQAGAERRPPSQARSRGLSRSYSQDSLDGRSRVSMDRPWSRSRDDLFDSRSRSNFSPSRHPRGGSWSSDEDVRSRRGGGGGGRRGGGGGWNEKPPSYTEYEPGQKPGGRRNERYSDKSSRNGTSIVI